jgi:hypothetical protein
MTFSLLQGTKLPLLQDFLRANVMVLLGEFPRTVDSTEPVLRLDRLAVPESGVLDMSSFSFFCPFPCNSLSL